MAYNISRLYTIEPRVFFPVREEKMRPKRNEMTNRASIFYTSEREVFVREKREENISLGRYVIFRGGSRACFPFCRAEIFTRRGKVADNNELFVILWFRWFCVYIKGCKFKLFRGDRSVDVTWFFFPGLRASGGRLGRLI